MPINTSSLSNHVAFITGVSRPNGIGFAVARRLGWMGQSCSYTGGRPAISNTKTILTSFG